MKLPRFIALLWLVPAFGLIQLAGVSSKVSAAGKPLRVYIGTYTGEKSGGIYTAQFDPATGEVSKPELAVETKNPSFLTVHPRRQVLYAVGELDSFNGQRAGAVSAFKIKADGGLTLLNQEPSGGTGPCHLSVEKSGACLLVANYGSGSVAALPLESGGKLGGPAISIQHRGSSVDRQRQAGPHAHFIAPDLSNRFVLACDLGLDQVLVYKLDALRGALSLNAHSFATLKPGSGPRHLACHPNGRFVYLINELSSTLTAFAYDAKAGALSELETLATLPDDFHGANTAAEVQVHPSGRFVYASDRGHDSITVFAIDDRTGRLTFVERQATLGKTPRHFTLDPSGRWLLAENQDSSNIVVFKVEPLTGRLVATGKVVAIGSPACLVFLPHS